MNKELSIGLCARCDGGGLASLSYDFWKHILDIKKELVVLSGIRDNPYLYPKATICENRPTLEEIDRFLEDINIVLIFETPYNWNILSKAKEKGVKTILVPMYEWSDVVFPVMPDLILCPSELDYQTFKEYPTRVEYLPIPVDREEIPFKLRTKAETFVFNNGGGGTGGRNGMEALMKAIPLVKADVKFLIRSQLQLPIIEDKRVEIEFKHFTNKSELFERGDVFLFPHMFDGLSLPIQEALSAGMPVISTNFFPHNTYMPKEWFFDPDGFKQGRVAPVARTIDVAILSPEKIAKKIDEWANKDITDDSEKANEIAEKISWVNLHQKYIDMFKSLL